MIQGQTSGSLAGVGSSTGIAAVAGRRPAAARARPQGQGMGLRAKFTVMMVVLTSLGMCALGLSMAFTADTFLKNQTKHDGVQMVKMAAVIGRLVYEHARNEAGAIDSQVLKNSIETYLPAVRLWRDEERFSFVDGISFDGAEISGMGIGNMQDGSSQIIKREHTVSIAGLGTVLLQDYDIEIYRVLKSTGGQTIPVFRFRVNIPDREGTVGDSPMRVRLDLRIASLDKVSTRLYVIIIFAVLVMIALTALVANVMAGKITRPVKLLMRDMQIVAQGNLDHRTKPRSTDEVGILAHEFNAMTQNLKVAQSALVEQEKAEYELSIAREVQQQLLPAQLPQIPGYDPGAYYQGAKAVSGDYFDFIPLGNGLWGFIVADVSGKGVPGSMVMAVTRTIIRLVAPGYGVRAADTLKETNRLIAKQIKRGMFVTAFYLVLDTNTGQITYASAGHNPMVIYRYASRQVELAQPKGIAIGFNEGPLFDKNMQEHTNQLAMGDHLVIYTDGFPEAMNERDQEFGDDRFYATIGQFGAQPAQGMVEGLVQAILQFRGRAPQSDDLTLINLRRVG